MQQSTKKRRKLTKEASLVQGKKTNRKTASSQKWREDSENETTTNQKVGSTQMQAQKSLAIYLNWSFFQVLIEVTLNCNLVPI